MLSLCSLDGLFTTEQGLCVQDDACMVDVLLEERKDVLVGYKGKRKRVGRREECEGRKAWKEKVDSLSVCLMLVCMCAGRDKEYT